MPDCFLSLASSHSTGLYNKFQTKAPTHLTSADNYVMPHRKEMLFLNPPASDHLMPLGKTADSPWTFLL